MKKSILLLCCCCLLSLAACSQANSSVSSEAVLSSDTSQSMSSLTSSSEDQSDAASSESSEAPSSATSSESESPQGSSSEALPALEPTDSTESGGILIAYFSRVGNSNLEDGVDAVTSASINLSGGAISGNSQLLALQAQEATGGDLFFIETADKYPSTYRGTTNQAKEEQNINARPALASHVENIDAYDTVILVYPNWWGTLPMPLFTFLEEYDFSGKTILPICTHEGSGMGTSENDLAALCPDAQLMSGLAIRGGNAASSAADVTAYLRESGIIE